jgi:hypothetical protein
MNQAERHTGSTFDSFLEEEGILDEVKAVAAKRVIAWQLTHPATSARVTMAELLVRFDPEKHRHDLVLDDAPAGTETQCCRPAHERLLTRRGPFGLQPKSDACQ